MASGGKPTAGTVGGVAGSSVVNASSLPMGVTRDAMPATPAGAKQNKPNVDGSTWYGYQGVCPQSGTQLYVCTVYALDIAALPVVTPQSKGTDALTAVMAHQLATATLGGMQTH